jgi:cytochrome c556
MHPTIVLNLSHAFASQTLTCGYSHRYQTILRSQSMTRNRILALAVASLCGLAASLPAAAQFQKPEDAVKYRKAAFTVMATHFGRIGAMVNGRVPFDGAAAAANADVVAALSKLPYAGFVEGTGGTEKGAPKANVWSDRANFDEGARKMQDAVAKLAVAAKGNNLDQLKAAFGPAAGSCKDCHDNYRNP